MASEKKLNPHMLDADEASQTKQKQRFQQMMTRKMFVVPSFEIYGGVAGLYDYGPPGSALFQSIVNIWRQHFVFQEEMLEISGPAMTPEPVLKASGHVDRFSDFMVKDEKTGDCYRADKLIEAHMDTLLAALKPDQSALKHEYDKVRTEAGAMKGPALDEVIKKYKIVAPDTGNALGSAYTFNLMFKTSIGPTGKITGYLRPETAQGIFVNFKRLLEYNGGKLPFAAAQIGPAFRNEIAPRSGLIRVREFTLAEIEHFVDPEDKSHPKFSEVADLQLQLLSQAGQEDGANKVEKVTLRDAVKKGTINSETLAYFLGRTYLFLTRIGIKSDKLRFRQHQHDEMAHYAKDCWDAEIFTTYGWVECVGHADRADYDLSQHTLESKTVLEASKVHEKPIEVEKHTLNFNFKDMASKFQKKAKDVQDELKRKSKAEIIAFEQLLNTKGAQEISICTGEKFTIEPGMFKIAFRKEKEQVKNFVPHVIEPSFGLGRIFYALLEHSFDDSQYTEENQKLILRLPAVVAPLKALIAPVTTNENLVEFSKQVNREFVRRNLSTKTDFSGVSIGKKYARADELGVPFCVSIDPDSLTDKCIVIRDRESTNQIRVKIEDGVFVVDELVRGNLTWEQAYEKYPKFFRPEN